MKHLFCLLLLTAGATVGWCQPTALFYNTSHNNAVVDAQHYACGGNDLLLIEIMGIPLFTPDTVKIHVGNGTMTSYPVTTAPGAPVYSVPSSTSEKIYINLLAIPNAQTGVIEIWSGGFWIQTVFVNIVNARFDIMAVDSFCITADIPIDVATNGSGTIQYNVSVGTNACPDCIDVSSQSGNHIGTLLGKEIYAKAPSSPIRRAILNFTFEPELIAGATCPSITVADTIKVKGHPLDSISVPALPPLGPLYIENAINIHPPLPSTGYLVTVTPNFIQPQYPTTDSVLVLITTADGDCAAGDVDRIETFINPLDLTDYEICIVECPLTDTVGRNTTLFPLIETQATIQGITVTTTDNLFILEAVDSSGNVIPGVLTMIDSEHYYFVPCVASASFFIKIKVKRRVKVHIPNSVFFAPDTVDYVNEYEVGTIEMPYQIHDDLSGIYVAPDGLPNTLCHNAQYFITEYTGATGSHYFVRDIVDNDTFHLLGGVLDAPAILSALFGSTAGSGTVELTAVLYSSEGCEKVYRDQFFIAPAITPTIVANDTFCPYNGTPIPLPISWSPMVGNVVGREIIPGSNVPANAITLDTATSLYYLTPSLVGTSNQPFTLRVKIYMEDSLCAPEGSWNFRILPLLTPGINMPDVFCTGDNAVSVLFGPPGGMESHGAGFSAMNTNAGTALFDPGNINMGGASQHSTSMTYTVANTDGCLSSVTKQVTVKQSSVTTLNVPPSLCDGDPVVNFPAVVDSDILQGTYHFTVDGVASPVAIPNNAPDTLNIWGYHTNTVGCEDSVQAQIVVNALPSIGLTTVDVCEGDTLPLEPLLTLYSLVPLASTTFIVDGNDTVTSSPAEYIFNRADNFSVRVIATDINGCTSIAQNEVIAHAFPEIISIKVPVAFCNADTFTTEVQMGTIVSVHDFISDIRLMIDGYAYLPQGSNLGGTQQLIKTLSNNTGNKPLLVSATMNGLCTSVLDTSIFIMPIITPTPTVPYFEDFDTLAQIGDTWQVKNGIFNSDGVSANNLPISFEAYSSCFQITHLDKPMLAFERTVQEIKSWEGVVIEYYDFVEAKWKVLGNPPNNTANTWWQYSTISDPLAPYGFRKDNEEDIPSRIALDQFKNKTLIIRARFKGTDNTNPNAKIAIDNFTVKNREHNVLVTTFTNKKYTDMLEARAHVYYVLFGTWTIFDGVLLEVHTDVPDAPDDGDEFNIVSEDASASLQLHYNFDTNGIAIIDGNFGDDDNNKVGMVYLTEDNLSYERLKDNKFDINVNEFFVVGNQLYVNVGVKSKKSLPPASYTLQICLVQDSLLYPNSPSLGYNMAVLRKMYPGPDGTVFNHWWGIGQEEFINGQYELPTGITSNNLELVVYLENYVTKEVFQTVSTRDLTVFPGYYYNSINEVEPEVLEQAQQISNMKLYPNPASNHFTVEFDLPLPQEYQWRLTDMRGVTVQSGLAPANITQMTIEQLDLPAGMYLFSMHANKFFTQRKVIIRR